MSKERMAELVATTKATRASIEKEICSYIETPKQERYHLIFDGGWLYLKLMEGDPYCCEQIHERFMQIATNSSYWAWWQTQWFARDLLFKEKIMQDGNLGENIAKRQEIYWRWNHPRGVRAGTKVDQSYYQFLEIQGL